MADILNIIYVAAVVFLLFGAAIFVHEFGHFWVALKRGLKVEEFAIGFGPIIWSKTPTSGKNRCLADCFPFLCCLFPVHL